MSGPVYRAGAARRSKVARDLSSPKYKQRIVPSKRIYSRSSDDVTNVDWDELRRKISTEWRETLDFLAKD
jgi:hypothetical protein